LTRKAALPRELRCGLGPPLELGVLRFERTSIRLGK
jgi:hypothetical protein